MQFPPSIQPVNPFACFGFPQHQGKNYCNKIFAPPMQITGPTAVTVSVSQQFGYTTGNSPFFSWYYGVTGGIIGDAYTFQGVSGSLNPGLVLLSNGVVSGVVQAAASPQHFIVRATNCGGCSVDLPVTVTVNQID